LVAKRDQWDGLHRYFSTLYRRYDRGSTKNVRRIATTNAMTTYEQIEQVILDSTGVAVTPDALIESLKLDSLDLLDLLLSIERETGAHIPDEVLAQGSMTMQSLADYVDKCLLSQ
jgi:acyl carrier protein